MRIGFLVNDVQTEEGNYTTSRLGQAAVNRGHEVWIMGVGDIAYDPDNMIRARAVSTPKQKYGSPESYTADFQSRHAVRRRITVDELDVLMLRNHPAEDYLRRPWASTAAPEFSRLAQRHGVIVLSDPNGLTRASNKMYYQLFPAEVRPRTLITRDREEIKHFASQHGSIVIKPMFGCNGAGVFVIRPDDLPNLNQMIDAVSRDGFVMAQEYLTAAEGGDLRLFVMNGRPLRVKSKPAVFRRVRTVSEQPGHVHTHTTHIPCDIDNAALTVAEIVRPRLVQDGMFLVALDIVGDKLMDINVFSPGGLGSAQQFQRVNFAQHVIEAIERKVEYVQFYGRNFDNVRMCTL